MPRKRSNAVTAGNTWASDAAPVAAENGSWGIGAAEANGAWGAPQHANSPVMNSNPATDVDWNPLPTTDWGDSGGGATGWKSPTVPAQQVAAKKSKKDKKDKKSGASKVSFALDEPSAATSTAPPPQSPAQVASAGWGSSAGTTTGYGDYNDDDGQGDTAQFGYWDGLEPEVPAVTPAAAKPVQSGWLNWASEAKGLPQVTTSITATAKLVPPTLHPAPPTVSVTSRTLQPVLSPQERTARLASLLSDPTETKSAHSQSHTSQTTDAMRRNHVGPAVAPSQQEYQRFHAQLAAQVQATHQAQQQAQYQLQQQTQRVHQAQLQAQLQVQRAYQERQAAFSQQARENRGQSQYPQQQQGFAQNQSTRAPPMQQQDSWGSNTGWSGGGWGPDWTEAIPEEDEEESEEEEDEEEEEEEGWRANEDDAHVRFSPGVSYRYDPPAGGAYPPAPPAPPAPAVRSTPQHSGQQIWTPSPSVTSKIMSATAGGKTTVFEHAPPRTGMGEMTTHESSGAALFPAHRALYGAPPQLRLARDRIHWMFNPEKDPRVSGLLRWVSAFQNGLATLGVSLRDLFFGIGF